MCCTANPVDGLRKAGTVGRRVARHRGPRRRREGPAAAGRGGGRGGRSRAERHARIPAAARGVRADVARRLAAHRRRRPVRRGRVPDAGRPGQGSDHPRRREHLPEGDRERPVHPPGGAGSRSRRAPGSGPRRGTGGLRRAAPRLSTSLPTTSSSTAAAALARYKVPRAVFIDEALPKNAVGKISKPDLRARLRAASAMSATTDGGAAERSGRPETVPQPREVTVHAIETAGHGGHRCTAGRAPDRRSPRIAPLPSRRVHGQAGRSPAPAAPDNRAPVGQPGRGDRQGRRREVHDRPGHAGPPVHRSGVDAEPGAAPGAPGLPGDRRQQPDGWSATPTSAGATSCGHGCWSTT